MDKNTVTGLLLIAVVMFGFFYCSKPATSPQQQQQTTQQEDALPSPDANVAITIDTLHLQQAVALLGTQAADGSRDYAADGITLHVDAAGAVSGSVITADDTVGVVDILAQAQGTELAAERLQSFINNTLRYQRLAKQLGGEGREIVLENDLVKVTLNSRGAMVSQVELKNYKTELFGTPQPVRLFHPDSDGYSFSFNTADQRIDTRDFNFEISAQTDSSVVFTLNPTAGASWNIAYVLKNGTYVVDMQLSQAGMDRYLPVNTSTLGFTWHQKMGRNEIGKTFETRNSAIYYKYVGEGPDDLNSAKDDSEELNGRVRWVAFKNQFFSSVIVAHDVFSAGTLNSMVIKDEELFLKDMTMTASAPYSINDGVFAAFSFYFGPNDYDILKNLHKTIGTDENLNLTRLIPLGWTLFRWINTYIVIPVFNLLSPIGNYGIIILLLTIFIKIIIFPFTFKSYKSQAKMRVLAPEIKQINEKYPDQADATKRTQETMALYSRAGASPFSGCLPMLLQMPVLIAMFSFFPSAIDLRGQSFLWVHDLSAPDSILTLPFSIPFYGNHVSLFCLLMTIVNIMYIRISMSSQPGGASMPGMKVMQYLMPIMFLFIFNDYASGLTYYYFLSLLITIVQTWVFKRFTNEEKLRQQMRENAKKPRKKSGFMARLEEASRQAQAAQRAQQRRR